MNGTSRDQKLLSDHWVTDLPSDLEFHLAFQHDDQFVGCMREIFPSPSRRVDPEVATEPPLRPIGGNLFPVDTCHHEMCLQESGQSRSVARSQHELIDTGSSFREIRTNPLLELHALDLGTPGARDLHYAFHLIVREPRLDQFLQIRKKHVVEELTHLMGNLLVERLGGDGRLFLLLGSFLLSQELLVVLLADCQGEPERP